MIQRISMGVLLGAGLLVTVLEDGAVARSVSAATAAVFVLPHLVDDPCAEFSYDTGAVFTNCLATVIVPLTTDRSGTKTLTFTSRTDLPTLGDADPSCRAVATNRFGSAVSASLFVEIPRGLDVEVESRTTDPVVVPSMGVFFAHCIVNETTELNEFDHAP